jgi:hypothetical protein
MKSYLDIQETKSINIEDCNVFFSIFELDDDFDLALKVLKRQIFILYKSLIYFKDIQVSNYF